jgi:hypothetical protein
MTPTFGRNSRGFTRLELLFVVLAVLLVIVGAFFMQRHLGPTGKRIRCAGQLKQVGLGLVIWMTDHFEGPPWRKTIEDGGHLDSQSSPFRSELWFQFAWISNELASPKILVDPAETDPAVRAANTWDAKGGLADPQFRDSACSYALALDFIRSATGPIPIELVQNGVLVTDRHLLSESKEEECSPSKMNATAFLKPFRLNWGKQIHGPSGGNVGLIDASVDFMSPSRVAAILPANSESPYSDNPSSSAHLLFPRRTNSADLR